MPDGRIFAALALAAALTWLPTRARAQTAEGEARCLLLGPLAVSGYVAFLDRIAARDRDAVAVQAASTGELIELYRALDCAMPPLVRAPECVSAAAIDPAGSRRNRGELAETCMRDAGMPTR